MPNNMLVAFFKTRRNFPGRAKIFYLAGENQFSVNVKKFVGIFANIAGIVSYKNDGNVFLAI